MPTQIKMPPIVCLIIFNLYLAGTAVGCEDIHVSEIRRKFSDTDKKVTVFSATDGRNLEYLKYLKDIPELRHVKIGGKEIKQEHVKLLTEIKSLQILSIKNTELISEDLNCLSTLSNLSNLKLENNPMLDDNIFKSLQKLKLETLELQLCPGIRGKYIEMLVENVQLKVLNLSATNMDDEATISLAKMHQLQKLNLSHTKITEQGVRNLLGLTQLTSFHGPNLPEAKAIELAKIAIAARQKARSEGKTTAPDNLAPYASSLEK